MVRYCYACNKKQTNTDMCLHKFPNNPLICLRWKQFCGLREVDDVKALYICSSHFCAEAFHWNLISGKTKLLKSDAVPSIRSRKQKSGKKTEVVSTREIIKAKEVLCMNMTNKTEELHLEMVNDENVEPLVNTQSKQFNIESGTTKVAMKTQDIVITKQTEIIEPQEMSSNDISINTCISNGGTTSCSTPRKRKYMEPRYISEIMTSHVETPRRANKIIKFVKANALKQQQIIERLQRSNRNLRKHIRSLESMLAHLKEKQLIPENAAETFLV